MPTLVKMPKWGLTMTEGTVTDWLLAEGAEISAGDPLFTVETEKAVNDIEAPIDGVLLRLVADKGAAVPVSGPIAIIAAPGESLSEAEIAAFLDAAAPKKKESAAAAASAGGGRESRAGRQDDPRQVHTQHRPSQTSSEQGLELASLDATGPGGRITIDDVERAMAERDADPTPREETVTLAD
ncbi:MAG: biotin/lipoyl-containing protein, partial [Thermomicrobiales bacterium]